MDSTIRQVFDPAFDILTGLKGTVIPKPHDLGFCFIATASTHKEFFGLMFAPQTNPASPAVLVEVSKRRILIHFVDSRDVCSIALSSFPGLPIFLPRCDMTANFGVRVYVSIVAGGSVTRTILPSQAFLEGRSFGLTNIAKAFHKRNNMLI